MNQYNQYEIDSVVNAKGGGKGFGEGKRKGDGSCHIFVDNLGSGPGNVPATPREEVRVVRVLVRAGRGQAIGDW